MMSLTEYARQIRELADNYYCHRITTDEYHMQRQQLLNEIDMLFNNVRENEDNTDDAIVSSNESDTGNVTIDDSVKNH